MIYIIELPVYLFWIVRKPEDVKEIFKKFISYKELSRLKSYLMKNYPFLDVLSFMKLHETGCVKKINEHTIANATLTIYYIENVDEVISKLPDDYDPSLKARLKYILLYSEPEKKEKKDSDEIKKFVSYKNVFANPKDIQLESQVYTKSVGSIYTTKNKVLFSYFKPKTGFIHYSIPKSKLKEFILNCDDRECLSALAILLPLVKNFIDIDQDLLDSLNVL